MKARSLELSLVAATLACVMAVQACSPTDSNSYTKPTDQGTERPRLPTSRMPTTSSRQKMLANYMRNATNDEAAQQAADQDLFNRHCQTDVAGKCTELGDDAGCRADPERCRPPRSAGSTHRLR